MLVEKPVDFSVFLAGTLSPAILAIYLAPKNKKVRAYLKS